MMEDKMNTLVRAKLGMTYIRPEIDEPSFLWMFVAVCFLWMSAPK
jgi:hypothetical protein